LAKQIKWVPPQDTAERWESFVTVKEAAAKRKHLGNGLLSEAVRYYLDATAVPSSGVQAQQPGANAEQNEQRSVRFDTIPEFAGLAPEQIEIVREVAKILRGGGTWKQLVENVVTGWREIENPKGVRAVADPVVPGKSGPTKSAAKGR
jgi:hypothetical protein